MKATAKNRDERKAELVAKFSKLTGLQIFEQIEIMKAQARNIGDSLVRQGEMILVHDLENHFFLVMNPQFANGSNLEHAKKHGFPIPA